jgi:hypothetical protein
VSQAFDRLLKGGEFGMAVSGRRWERRAGRSSEGFGEGGGSVATNSSERAEKGLSEEHIECREEQDGDDEYGAGRPVKAGNEVGSGIRRLTVTAYGEVTGEGGRKERGWRSEYDQRDGED